MAYVFLVLAIAAEVVGTTLLKFTGGFTRPAATTACLLAYAAAFALLSQVVKQVPVGVAYALWAGLGTASVVAIGVVFLGEPVSVLTVVGTALVIAGVVTLLLSGVH